MAKGSSVRIEATLRALQALGHEVRALTPAGPSKAWDFLPHDTVALPEGNHLARMLAWREAARGWLAGRDADMVQFRGHWEGVPALAWAAEHKACTVFEAHGFPSVELPAHYPALEERPSLVDKLITEEQTLIGGADLLLSHSLTGHRYLLSRGARPERVAVVPNFVDTALFTPPPAPPAEPGPMRVVYVGTLAPWQGLGVLLEAFSRLRGRVPAELHVIGPRKGAWHRELSVLARRLRVRPLLKVSGAMARPDLAAVLRTAQVCTAPLPSDERNSGQGCCPLKVLEYMAAGRPILATSAPPLREILTHMETAYLAKPGSPAALAEGLSWLAAHPAEREALGVRARERALAAWTPGHFHDRLGAALARLAQPIPTGGTP
ncbi:MAG: glycosyltransferase family 4 protein [Elusimicrobia bacterium]|nr:glycosyltransferase family 4 protein [Elusimicrobiota bacterium]